MSSLDHLEGTDRELLDVARRAARAAAGVHRSRSSQGRAWVEKGRADFVTEVDMEAQEVIVGTIRESFPGHTVVAEEEEAEGGPDSNGGPATGTATAGDGRAGLRWVVDPLDGTTNWLHGYPAYAASLAIEDQEGLRLGVVLNSATDELFEAVRGAGSWRDGEPIRVSRVSELRLALVGTGFPFKKPEYLDEYLRVFRHLLMATSGVRRAGSASLDLCDLACGRLDAFWEHWLMPWDVAGGALILQEAGGRLDRLRLPDDDPRSVPPPGASPDAPLTYATRRGAAYVASNGALHEEITAAVRGRGES